MTSDRSGAEQTPPGAPQGRAAGRLKRQWGAEPLDPGRYRFRLWAPALDALSVRLAGRDLQMQPSGDGWFEIEAPARGGEAYAFVSPDLTFPDPAARAQQGDVHGPSLLVDPGSYVWRTVWPGRAWTEAVIYELHVGTFTSEGTFDGVRGRLDYLAQLGVTAIELMPVAQFGGDRGWGYDGVLPYAPHRAYGAPDDLRRLVDAAHGRGMMVLLDVVYNHFGPDGNYLHHYAPQFFDALRQTPWGAAIAYDRPPVRAFFIENALYWLEEFRLDGLRLDAVDHIRDPKSQPELLVELAERVRAHGFGRPVHLTTEDNRNITRLHRPAAGLYDGEWNDDFHHAAHCLLTGERESYYADFAVDPMHDLEISLREGYVEQGQARASGKPPRGEPSRELPPAVFVNFLQNHDQVGNRALGERLGRLASVEHIAVMAGLHLLSPFIPLIFMGEEWNARTPFLFFADYPEDLARLTREGRRREFAEFLSFGAADIPDPCAPSTFERSRLDWNHGAAETAHLDLVRRLLALRRRHVLPLVAGGVRAETHVARPGPRALTVEWRFPGGRLGIAANLGAAPAAGRATGESFYARNDIAADPWALLAWDAPA